VAPAPLWSSRLLRPNLRRSPTSRPDHDASSGSRDEGVAGYTATAVTDQASPTVSDIAAALDNRRPDAPPLGRLTGGRSHRATTQRKRPSSPRWKKNCWRAAVSLRPPEGREGRRDRGRSASMTSGALP
jgi:hypothetical protein